MRIIQGVAVAAEELVLEIRALERAGTTMMRSRAASDSRGWS